MGRGRPVRLSAGHHGRGLAHQRPVDPVEKDFGQKPMKSRAATSTKAGSLSLQAMSAGGSTAATRAKASDSGPKNTRAAALRP